MRKTSSSSRTSFTAAERNYYYVDLIPANFGMRKIYAYGCASNSYWADYVGFSLTNNGSVYVDGDMCGAITLSNNGKRIPVSLSNHSYYFEIVGSSV